jgi:hypothetical protein
MGTFKSSPEAIIIGAGPSGIAMAHTMKNKLGYNDFMVSYVETISVHLRIRIDLTL